MGDDDRVIISNREIYEAVQRIDRLLERYIATNDLRVGYLGDLVEEMDELAKAREGERASRSWALTLAVIGPLISVPLSIWGITKGVG